MADAAPELTDPRFTAALDLLRRTGAKSTSIRWSDDEEPTVWMAVVEWRVDPTRGVPMAEAEGEYEIGYDAAAALHPLPAVLRLCEQVVGGPGSFCVHCQRPGGFAADLKPRADKGVCWYQWDPELETFRRSCEGDYQAPGRNDQCPCGSGKKFKKCHGA